MRRDDAEDAGALPYGVRLRLAYDGTAFAGFQAQPGQRTVQGVVAEAAERVTCHPVELRGASRTDAGVHAEGQVAAFGTRRLLAPPRWVFGLNRYLPPDLAVREVEACAADYDPRFDARDKTYRYLFHLGVARDPLLRDRVWQLGRYVRHTPVQHGRLGELGVNLDLAAMRAAATALEGTHDFRAFRAASDTREDTVRTLSAVSLDEGFRGDPQLLALTVVGTAFMKNMVRIVAGTLIDIGRGQLEAGCIERLLGSDGRRSDAGITAPPQGLSLLRVNLGRLHARASR